MLVTVSQPRTPVWMELRQRGAVRPEQVLGRFAIRTPPIPMIQIAWDIQIGVWSEDHRDWHAYYKVDETAAGIWVRTDLDDASKARCVAHLLAHILIHPLPAQSAYWMDTKMPIDPRERQAEHWAGALLMPQWLVDPLVARTRDLERIAWLFRVPVPFARMRLHSLFPRIF